MDTLKIAETLPFVLVMLKAPVEGTVKTRLGLEIGLPAATRAYRRLVEHQLRQVPHGWPVRICCAPAEAMPSMREWLGAGYEYAAQGDGDLGQRLAAAMHSHFHGSGSPLIIIGGDCPYLTAGWFTRAASILSTEDAVLVPAVDGGYCLIGLRKTEEHVFRSIPWSSENVLAETRRRLSECGRSWQELEVLEDVDDHASWKRAVAAFPELGDGRSE